jgi:hypothetical protein
MTRRFQECDFWERMWRRRHYWRVPFDFVRYLLALNQDVELHRDWRMRLNVARQLSWSMAHQKMEWWFTWDECFGHLEPDTCKGDVDLTRVKF